MPRALTRIPLIVPTSGANVGTEEPLISPEFVWKSNNVIPRFGELRTRPGYHKAATSGPGERIVGGVFFKTAGGVNRCVAAGLTKLWLLGASSWSNITGAVLTGTVDSPARFTVFPSGGANNAIFTNNIDAMRIWDGVAGTFSALGGGPPLAADICSCFNRVVAFNVSEAGIRSKSRLRISDFNDPNTWPAGNVFDTTDTNDDGVGIRTLSRSSFLAYKESSIWIGVGQAGVFPFQVDILAQDIPGPLSSACIVSANGVHYYLGVDYRVYRVTANGPEDISTLVDKELITRVRLTNKARAWGVYRRIDQTVWFFFPSPSNSDPDQAISVDIHSGAIHFHTFTTGLTAGWQGDSISTLTWLDLLPFTWANIANTYPTWESMGGSLIQTEFVADVNGQVHRMSYDFDDDGTSISQSWELPPKTWAGADMYTDFDSIENSFEQLTGGPAVAVDIGVSEALGEADGPTYTEVGQHDTSSTGRQVLSWQNEVALRGRFMNVRYRVNSSIITKWKGGIAYAAAEEVPS